MKLTRNVITLMMCLVPANLYAVVTFDWATVGDPGNAADQDYGSGAFGAVADVYSTLR